MKDESRTPWVYKDISWMRGAIHMKSDGSIVAKTLRLSHRRQSGSALYPDLGFIDAAGAPLTRSDPDSSFRNDTLFTDGYGLSGWPENTELVIRELQMHPSGWHTADVLSA